MSTPVVMSAQLNAAKSISNYKIEGEQLHEIGVLHQIGRAINDFFKGMTAGGKLEIANRNLRVASKLAELVVADTAMQMDAEELLMEPTAQNQALMGKVVKESFDALKLKAHAQNVHPGFGNDFGEALDNLAGKMPALTDSQQSEVITALRYAVAIEQHIDTNRLNSTECALLRGKLLRQISDFTDRLDDAQTTLMEGGAAGGASVHGFNESIEKAFSSMKTGMHYIASLQAHLHATPITAQTPSIEIPLRFNALNNAVEGYFSLLDKIHDAPNLSLDKKKALNAFLEESHADLASTTPADVPNELRKLDTIMFPPTIDNDILATAKENFHTILSHNMDRFENPTRIARQFSIDTYRSGLTKLGDNPLPQQGLDAVLAQGTTSPWYGHASEAAAPYYARRPARGEALEQIGTGDSLADSAQIQFFDACIDEFLGVDFAYKDFIYSLIQQGGVPHFCTIDMPAHIGLWGALEIASLGVAPTMTENKTIEITRVGENIQVKLSGELSFSGVAPLAANNIVGGLFDSPWEVTVTIPSGQNLTPTSTAKYLPEFTVDFNFTQSPALR